MYWTRSFFRAVNYTTFLLLVVVAVVVVDGCCAVVAIIAVSFSVICTVFEARTRTLQQFSAYYNSFSCCRCVVLCDIRSLPWAGKDCDHAHV